LLLVYLCAQKSSAVVKIHNIVYTAHFTARKDECESLKATVYFPEVQSVLNKAKIKVVIVHTMKACGEVDVELHSFLTSALVGGVWPAPRIARFSPGERGAVCH
jgi:hypothetical protein